MKFVARDVAGERMEIMEIPGGLIKINDTPQGTWVQQFTNVCLWTNGKTHYFHITSSIWHLVRNLWLLITFLRPQPRLPLKQKWKKSFQRNHRNWKCIFLLMRVKIIFATVRFQVRLVFHIGDLYVNTSWVIAKHPVRCLVRVALKISCNYCRDWCFENQS